MEQTEILSVLREYKRTNTDRFTRRHGKTRRRLHAFHGNWGVVEKN
jgi:hypothetical protein